MNLYNDLLKRSSIDDLYQRRINEQRLNFNFCILIIMQLSDLNIEKIKVLFF